MKSGYTVQTRRPYVCYGNITWVCIEFTLCVHTTYTSLDQYTYNETIIVELLRFLLSVAVEHILSPQMQVISVVER